MNPTWMALQETRAEEPVLGLIGLGNCGANLITETMHHINPQFYKPLHCCMLDADRAKLIRNLDPERNARPGSHFPKWREAPPEQFQVHVIGRGMGSGGRPEVGARYAEQHISVIEQFLEPVDTVLILAGGGGGTATGAAPVVAKKAKEMGKSPLTWLTLPWLDEGREQLDRAKDTMKELLEIGPTAVIHNERIADGSGRLSEIFATVNHRCLFPGLEFLRELIQKPGDVINRDLEDWRQTLAFGNYVVPGCVDVTNCDNIEAAIDVGLDNPFFEAEVLKSSRRFLLWFHGLWSRDDQALFVRSLERRMGINIQDPNVDARRGVLEDVDDNRKWVGYIGVARELGKEETPALLESGSVIKFPALMAAPLDNETIRIPVGFNGDEKHVPVPIELGRKWNGFRDRFDVDRAEVETVWREINQHLGGQIDFPHHLQFAESIRKNPILSFMNRIRRQVA